MFLVTIKSNLESYIFKMPNELIRNKTEKAKALGEKANLTKVEKETLPSLGRRIDFSNITFDQLTFNPV